MHSTSRKSRFHLARSAVRLLACVLFVAYALLGGTATARPADDTTTVVAVEVPVHVLVDGQPLRGLTREHFEIIDGRKTREVLDFEVVDLGSLEALSNLEASTEAPAPIVPLSARRHFLMLFDLSFAQPQAIVKAREAATNLVRDQFHPSDLVAVATYSGIQGVRLLHGFTPDRERTAFAIETLGAPQLVRAAPDPLGLLFGGLEGSIRTVQNQGRGGAARAEALLTFTRSLERQERRQMGERITDLSASFADLARLLDSAPGRKHVVYLSEGFDASVLFGTQDREAQQRMNQAVEDGRIWEVDSDERFGDAHSQNQLEKMFEEFRRSDCTLQTVNIGGLHSAADVGQGSRRDFERNRAALSGQDDALSLMAGATGGEYIRNFNDLSRAMGEVLERTALTYILTFEPADLKLDGKYHRLKVRLKGGPKGARVVHRPGYYAPQPFADASPQARRLQTSELLLGGKEGGSLDLAALAVPSLPTDPSAAEKISARISATISATSSATDSATNWVPVLLSFDGKNFTSRRPRDGHPEADDSSKIQLEIYAYAIDDEGTVHDFLSHSMTIDPTQAGPQLARGGIQFFGHLDLPPGSYNLRFLVRDNRNGAYGLRHQRLLVPAYAAGEQVVLEPLFLDTPGRALMVREDLAPGEELPPYPFLLNGQPFLPAVPAQVVGGESMTAALFLHGFAEPPQISTEIHTSKGQPATGATISVAAPTAGPEPGVWRAVLTLESGSLPAGHYLLEVRVADGRNRQTAFEVSIP